MGVAGKASQRASTASTHVPAVTPTSSTRRSASLRQASAPACRTQRPCLRCPRGPSPSEIAIECRRGVQVGLAPCPATMVTLRLGWWPFPRPNPRPTAQCVVPRRRRAPVHRQYTAEGVGPDIWRCVHVRPVLWLRWCNMAGGLAGSAARTVPSGFGWREAPRHSGHCVLLHGRFGTRRQRCGGGRGLRGGQSFAAPPLTPLLAF